MKTCCTSKCPRCWNKKDSEKLYQDLIHENRQQYLMGRIELETFRHNIDIINKYEGCNYGQSC